MLNPTIDDLKHLMESTERPCVSLYMPTHPGVAENQQDKTRFKNLLRSAEKGLEKAQLRSPDIKQLLAPAVQLGSDGLFWRQQNRGLAVFLSPGYFAHYRLPLPLDELAMVTDSFHLKPLLHLFSPEQFYLLALNLKGAQLLIGTRHHLSTIPLELPASLEEYLAGEERESQLQFRTFSPRGMGKQMSTFHGHGGGDENAKDDIRRYCRHIESVVNQHLRNQRIPLLLVGVNYLLPIYREVNTYAHLVDVSVEGNPDEFGDLALHQRAWAAIEPNVVQEQRRWTERFRELMGTGKASDHLKEVVLAAHHGRVEVLFVPLGVQKPGTVDPLTHTVELKSAAAPGQYPDVLDRAAIQVLATGGVVYAVEPEHMPDGTEVAAIFRY